MALLEELTRGAAVKGILPDGAVSVIDVQWHGSTVIELTYKDSAGRLGSELVFPDREPALGIAAAGRPWGVDGGGCPLRPGPKADRLPLAFIFYPHLAGPTSPACPP